MFDAIAAEGESMRVYIGFNHSEAWPIALASAPWSMIWRGQLANVPTHARIGFFDEQDRPGTSVPDTMRYFEAHIAGGWRGPYPEAKVRRWVAENPGKRWTRIYWLPCTDAESRRMLAEAQRRTCGPDEWLDNPRQLWDMLLHRVIRRPVPDSPNEIVCDEGAIRVVESGPCALFTWTRRKMFPNKSIEELTPYDLECIMRELTGANDPPEPPTMRLTMSLA
jgi:hypothetical protein